MLLYESMDFLNYPNEQIYLYSFTNSKVRHRFHYKYLFDLSSSK